MIIDKNILALFIIYFVVIRTNSASTTLTIDAEHDTIHHYDTLGALNIVKANTASYHENGKVAYAEISYGRIVLERGADVEEIHINKKENEQAFDTVIIANNGGTEELPERITRDAVEVSSQTLVVKVESNGSSENVYVYANGTIGTTEKVTEGENKQNEAVNSALGQLVLDNGSAGEKAQTSEQKAEAKQEVVNEAIENTEFKGVAVTKAGEATKLMTLEAFRDSVNAGNSYTGYTVKLLDNIDLANIEWAPIGTFTNPFSGIFDGQRYTIKNFKIRGSGKDVSLALFGVVSGTSETFTSTTTLSSFYDNSTYSVNLPNEDVFTCVIKNLNISGADINTTADGWTATVVSYIQNATISNVRLSDSVITAKEKAGGIVGFLPNNYACYITNCTTSSDVTITASTGNHSAGILGRVNSDSSKGIISNCTNNATINCAGVNGGGIAGQAKNVLYYNNTNNGSVTENTRAAGIATDCSGSVFIDCTNTGYISTTATLTKDNKGSSSNSMSGIAAYLASTGGNTVVNCQNSGTIEGTTGDEIAKIAGIAAGGAASSDVIKNNINTGTLINHAQNGKVYDICDLSSVATEVSPSDLSGLNEETAKGNKYIKVNSSLVLPENDNTVTFNGQEKLEFVNSPKYLTLDLSGANKSSFVLMVNDTVVTLKNAGDNYVTISGKGNTVVVEAGQSIKSLRVSNEDVQVASSLDFAGTADIILLNGVGLVNAEVKAGATVGRVCFGGTGTFVLTNRGTISHETEGQYGAEHTIATITASNIIIHNYGTIEAKKNENDVASYALLFYNGATVKLYAYNGSKIISEKLGVIATQNGTVCNVYYQDGAEVTSYGSQSTYPKAFGYSCTVTIMN